jgi:hypothetical protein
MTVRTEEGERTLDIWKRCPVAATRHLISLKRFMRDMRYGPEEHTITTADGRTIKVYSEMWTAAWWRRMQVRPKTHVIALTIIDVNV